MTHVLPFFQWCEQTTVGTVVRDSTWMFPILEVFHVIALGVLCGSILLVDLQVLGLRLPGTAVRRLVGDTQSLLAGSLAVIVASGVLLFASEAVKCYDNAAFWVKLALFALATVFTFTIRRRAYSGQGLHDFSAGQRAVAVFSTALWFGVGMAGRGIGFY